MKDFLLGERLTMRLLRKVKVSSSLRLLGFYPKIADFLLKYFLRIKDIENQIIHSTRREITIKTTSPINASVLLMVSSLNISTPTSEVKAVYVIAKKLAQSHLRNLYSIFAGFSNLPLRALNKIHANSREIININHKLLKKGSSREELIQSLKSRCTKLANKIPLSAPFHVRSLYQHIEAIKEAMICKGFAKRNLAEIDARSDPRKNITFSSRAKPHAVTTPYLTMFSDFILLFKSNKGENLVTSSAIAHINTTQIDGYPSPAKKVLPAKMSEIKCSIGKTKPTDRDPHIKAPSHNMVKIIIQQNPTFPNPLKKSFWSSMRRRVLKSSKSYLFQPFYGVGKLAGFQYFPIVFGHRRQIHEFLDPIKKTRML